MQIGSLINTLFDYEPFEVHVLRNVPRWDLSTFVVCKYQHFLGAQEGALFSNFGCVQVIKCMRPSVKYTTRCASGVFFMSSVNNVF